MPKYKCGQFISMHDRKGDKWLCRIVRCISIRDICDTCDFHNESDDICKCVARSDDKQKCILHIPVLSTIKKVRICQKKE